MRFVTTCWTRSVRSGHNQAQTRSVGGQRILTKGGRNGRENATGSLMATGGMLHPGAGMKHVAKRRDKKRTYINRRRKGCNGKTCAGSGRNNAPQGRTSWGV